MIKKVGYGKRATWQDERYSMSGNRTVWKAYTECDKENIPHVLVGVVWGEKHYQVAAPVKVRRLGDGASCGKLPAPMTNEQGFLIYALPGGGEFVSSYTAAG
jgi:hypothetical protein